MTLKRWIPASLLAVAVALVLAGGVVLAFGGAGDERRADVFERVAEILGIEPSQLEDAHRQANREFEDERLAEMVEKLVASGVIEQADADTFIAWITDRPDSADEALVALLTGPARIRPVERLGQLELHGLGLESDSRLVQRMAEILGFDSAELAEALSHGATGEVQESRMAAMHAVIDELKDAGSISTNEAIELHAWVDKTPQWILAADISSLLRPAFGIFEGGNLFKGEPGNFDFRRPFRPDHLGEGFHDFDLDRGDRDFHFAYRGPRGSFKFGPGENRTPFDSEEFRELFRDFVPPPFEGLEGFDGLQDLIERFRGRGYDIPPSINPGAPELPGATGELEISSTSA
ncbi:MAG: hypothetical protein O3B95_00995 [Chloroflexi bacterium]|nr:hypothetical protein [Chloroflexota bacterium]